MKNIDRIKQMDAEELAKWKLSHLCDSCGYRRYPDCFYDNSRSDSCIEGTKIWLERKV